MITAKQSHNQAILTCQLGHEELHTTNGENNAVRQPSRTYTGQKQQYQRSFSFIYHLCIPLTGWVIYLSPCPPSMIATGLRNRSVPSRRSFARGGSTHQPSGGSWRPTFSRVTIEASLEPVTHSSGCLVRGSPEERWVARKGSRASWKMRHRKASYRKDVTKADNGV